MTVQFNTDKNVEGSDDITAPFIASITEDLSRFSDHITRIEVHLSDEDGSKDGLGAKRCMLEARLSGRNPIAVTNTADNDHQAVDGAVDKMKTSLDTIFGRMRNY